MQQGSPLVGPGDLKQQPSAPPPPPQVRLGFKANKGALLTLNTKDAVRKEIKQRPKAPPPKKQGAKISRSELPTLAAFVFPAPPPPGRAEQVMEQSVDDFLLGRAGTVKTVYLEGQDVAGLKGEEDDLLERTQNTLRLSTKELCLESPQVDDCAMLGRDGFRKSVRDAIFGDAVPYGTLSPARTRFGPGGLVEVVVSPSELEALSYCHGGWGGPDMGKCCGRQGVATHVFRNGDVFVSFAPEGEEEGEPKMWRIHPKALCRVGGSPRRVQSPRKERRRASSPQRRRASSPTGLGHIRKASSPRGEAQVEQPVQKKRLLPVPSRHLSPERIPGMTRSASSPTGQVRSPKGPRTSPTTGARRGAGRGRRASSPERAKGQSSASIDARSPSKSRKLKSPKSAGIRSMSTGDISEAVASAAGKRAVLQPWSRRPSEVKSSKVSATQRKPSWGEKSAPRTGTSMRRSHTGDAAQLRSRSASNGSFQPIAQANQSSAIAFGRRVSPSKPSWPAGSFSSSFDRPAPSRQQRVAVPKAVRAQPGQQGIASSLSAIAPQSEGRPVESRTLVDL